MNLRLGFSSCPNDTFVFDAMVHARIDTAPFTFEVTIADVEELNRMAFTAEIDITKLSYAAWAGCFEHYAMLDAGSALGRGCGPLLIAREPIPEAELPAARVAIPGRMTTAFRLLGLAYPRITHTEEFLFSDIEDAVLSGRADAGLVIHETRFTYAERGLVCLRDLGEFWESTTGCPIPLGGIAVRRALPDEARRRLAAIMRASVEYAFAHPEAAGPFIRAHAAAMDESVMRRHIGLYVNDYSISLGADGRAAVRRLLADSIPPGAEYLDWFCLP